MLSIYYAKSIYIINVVNDSAAILMKYPAAAKMLITHAMKMTSPGFHDGALRSKRNIIPL